MDSSDDYSEDSYGVCEDISVIGDEEDYQRNLAIIGGTNNQDDSDESAADDVDVDIGTPAEDVIDGHYEEYVEIFDETKWSTHDQYFEERIVIAPEDRVTSNILSEFEYVSCISTRAHQIAHYANCMVDRGILTDPKQMAIKELLMRKCPLSIERPVGVIRNPNGSITKVEEWWSPNEMILPASVKY